MKRWQFWGGLAISAVFLWLVLRGLQPDDVWEALREAEYWWLAPGIASYMVAVWARAWRWHYLLRPLKRIPLRVSFPIVAIGYMGNNIYPARAGEVLRAYVLRRQEGVSMSASLATIVIERAFDGIVMLGFVFLNLPELARVTADSGVVGDIRTLAILGAVGFLLAVLAFLLMAALPTRAESMLGAMNERFVPDRFRPQARGLISRFLDGVAALLAADDLYAGARRGDRSTWRLWLLACFCLGHDAGAARDKLHDFVAHGQIGAGFVAHVDFVVVNSVGRVVAGRRLDAQDRDALRSLDVNVNL